jgi:hypothetical protein
LDDIAVPLQPPFLRASTADAFDEARRLESLQGLARSSGREIGESGRIGDAERHLDIVDQHSEKADLGCGAEDRIQGVAEGTSLYARRPHIDTFISN